MFSFQLLIITLEILNSFKTQDLRLIHLYRLLSVLWLHINSINLTQNILNLFRCIQIWNRNYSDSHLFQELNMGFRNIRNLLISWLNYLIFIALIFDKISFQGLCENAYDCSSELRKLYYVVPLDFLFWATVTNDSIW